jgi:hypothetical protein
MILKFCMFMKLAFLEVVDEEKEVEEEVVGEEV